MADNQKIAKNLRTLEREKTYEPYVVAIPVAKKDENGKYVRENGKYVLTDEDRTIVFTDPQEIPWQDLLEIDQPLQFMKHAVSEDDRVFLRDARWVPAWQFGEIIKGYLDHYGVDIPGNAGASVF